MPGAVCYAGILVAGDLLRGLGRPMAVAKAQTIALVGLGIALAILVPAYGVAGAAVANSLSSVVGLGLMVWTLRAPTPLAQGGDPASPGINPAIT